MPKLSAEQTAERRKRFLDAARRCFARDGFHKTTMAGVCAEAGLSVGAIYLYFSSKEDLILAVVDDRMEELQDTATGDLENLQGIFSALLAPDPSLDDIRLELGALYESFSNPGLHSRIKRNSTLIEAAILKLLRSLQQQDKIRLRHDPETTAKLIHVFISGLLFEQAVSKGELDKNRLADLQAAFGALLENSAR